MEAADDICYGLIDLEDGLEMELLEYAEVEELLLALVGDDIPETYRQLGPGDSRRRKLAILRGKAIEHLTNAAAAAFVEQQNNLLRGELPGDLVEHMHGPAKACVVQAKAMARQKIFQDKRKTLHEIGAYTTLEILLNAFAGGAGTASRRYTFIQEPADPRSARTQRTLSRATALPVVSANDRFHCRHDRQLRHGNGRRNDRSLQPGLTP